MTETSYCSLFIPFWPSWHVVLHENTSNRFKNWKRLNISLHFPKCRDTDSLFVITFFYLICLIWYMIIEIDMCTFPLLDSTLWSSDFSWSLVVGCCSKRNWCNLFNFNSSVPMQRIGSQLKLYSGKMNCILQEYRQRFQS